MGNIINGSLAQIKNAVQIAMVVDASGNAINSFGPSGTIVSSVNGESGALTITGAGSVAIDTVGSTITVSGSSTGITGPATTVDSSVVLWDGTDGSAVKDSGLILSGTTNDFSLTNGNGTSKITFNNDNIIIDAHQDLYLKADRNTMYGGNINLSGATVNVHSTQNFLQFLPDGVKIIDQNPDTSLTRVINPDVRVIKLYADGTGDAATILDAIILANNMVPTAASPVEINLGPGVFTADDIINVPSYVTIKGATLEQSTLQMVGGIGPHFVFMNANSNLEFLTVDAGNNRSGIIGVQMKDSQGYILLHKVYVINFDAGIRISDLIYNSNNYYYFEYVSVSGDVDGSVPSTGIIFDAVGNVSCDVTMTDCAIYSNGQQSFGLIANGIAAKLKCQGLIIEGYAGSGGIGLFLDAGINVTMQGLLVSNWDRCLYIGDLGSASYPVVLDLTNISLQNGNKDIDIISPYATGIINGVYRRSKTFVDANNTTLVFMQQSTLGKTSIIGNELYLGKTFPTSTYMSPLLSTAATMGLYSGGVMSGTSGLNLSVSAGSGWVDTNSTDWSNVKYISWDTNSITLPGNSDLYVYINSNGITSTSASSINGDTDKILLGRVVTTSSNIDYIENTPVQFSHQGNKIQEVFKDAFGPIVSNGYVVSTSGLKFSTSQGEYYWGTQSISSAGGNDQQYARFYHNASGLWFADWQISGNLPNTQYCNGSGLASIPAGNWVKHALWYDGIDNIPYLVVADTTYANKTDTELAPSPTAPTSFKDAILHICDFIISGSSTVVNEVMDTRPLPSFRQSLASAGASNNHSTLLNLSADDHTQYFLVNGNRSLTGNLNMGGNQITNAGLINNISISSHGSRHLPNGLDPLATGLPSNISVSVAGSGIANSFSKSDHIHGYTLPTPAAIGALPSGANTSVIPEGTNLYYTDARVHAAISGVSPISATNGIISIASGSASSNGYISSTDWTTFNNKQPSGNYLTSGSSIVVSGITSTDGAIFTGNVTAASFIGPDINMPVPHLGPKNFVWITPLGATTVNTFGQSAATVRNTLSLPGWSANYGYMQQMITTTTPGNDTGVYGSVVGFAQTSGLGYIGGGGYFAKFRFATPDASYVGASGCRIFVGMSTATGSGPNQADDFSGDSFGLQFCTASGSARQDTTFQLMSKDNTISQTLSGLSFAPAQNIIWDFYINAPDIPTGGSPYIDYKLENVTLGTSQEGRIRSTLPRMSQPLRPFITIATWPSGISPTKALRWSEMFVQGQY